MGRAIKGATFKRLRHASHNRLRTRLAGFMAAFNRAGRPEALNRLTSREYVAPASGGQAGRVPERIP